MIFCPLCLSRGHLLEQINGPGKREYRKCGHCKLIFTGIKYQLSRTQEKKRFALHENGSENPNYVKFLNKAIEPALPYLNLDMKGLDFRSGPVPALSRILEQREIQCDDYDPDLSSKSLTNTYDFVFATECFEHFFLPAKELKNLTQLLHDGGYLIIMTEQYNDSIQFRNWYYAKDPRHVSFYHKQTFDFICRKYGFNLVFSDDKSVVILQKEVRLPVDTGIMTMTQEAVM